MRLLKIVCVLMLAALGTSCATTRKMDRNQELAQTQYAYSAAIRWGDFEGAWNLVDPRYRKDHPMTRLDFERYKQLEVSGYEELGTQTVGDEVDREIAIGVVNRNTLVEHQVRYTERWKYDPAIKSWWLVTGLPDLGKQ